MGSFGNHLGATMGTTTNEEGDSQSIYDSAYVTNPNFSQRAALVDSHDGDNDGNRNEFVVVEDPEIEEDTNAKLPRSALLGEVPNLLSDDSTYNKVRDELTGGSALNWEDWTFVDLRKEKDALKPSELEDLATTWRDDGNTLKTKSEDFKESVGNAITGKWEGASADAAEAATQQVTKTSIYDFTPSSDALANRLTALKEAFDHIKQQFPGTANADLIDDGEFHKEKLEQRINEFNSKYHLDGSGYLRNNSDGYVTAADALKELERINNSIRDYERAVQLFRDTYNPTVQAVTQNFPTLPPPPNAQYGPTGPGPTGPGPTGPGPTGPGPTGPGTPPFNTPKFDTPPDTGKTPPIPDYPPPPGDQPPITNPPPGDQPPITNPPPPDRPTPTNPAQTAGQGLKTGLDAATQGMKSGLDAASQAAQKAAQQAAGAGQKPPSLREGALGLGEKAGGPKGLGGGAGAGGSGGLPAQQPAARLSTESASGVRPAVPTASTAGMGAMGGMGAPGMGGGGPAAGGRGAEGKEHKGNKALRTRKNGSDIVGDTEAVVPVLGDGPPPAEETQQPAPPHRRIPGQRSAPQQPDSAAQGSTRRSPQGHDPSSAASEQLMDQ
jgi:hypothetical protein